MLFQQEMIQRSQVQKWLLIEFPLAWQDYEKSIQSVQQSKQGSYKTAFILSTLFIPR